MESNSKSLSIITSTIQKLYDEGNFDLLNEVVYSALKYMKEDSSIDISEAIKHGYNEWSK